ncbi:MAG: hypothetical protein FJY85_06285, partial [Deltaproteobacteria bacterium]|nr:hypothetical protein [Deltaproteobacteria bacterium]
MNTRACTILIAILASAGIVLSLSSEAAFAAAYSPCRVPPVVSVGNKPNVMLVMDFSGSMQFPAYFDENFGGYYSSKVADCYNTSTSQIYLPANQYYGTFEPDTYYVYDSTNDYFVPANPQPVLYYQGTADSADGGAGTIEFTCDGHNFLVGDLVALYDLSSHKSLNGKGYQVAAVNGNKFKINATWNGKPDAKGYRAIKRISGNTAIGISGNILNLAITSRTDAALKALIGGKALCPSGDSYCYVQSQGARRYVSESTNVFANFYVRPATLQSPAQAYPDDYSDGSYTDKDIFVTISGEYSGTIDANDPVIPTSGGQYSEPWTFTLSRTTKVIIKLVGTWASSRGSRIAVSTASNFSVVTKEFTSSTTTTTFSWDLPAGTYYVRMAPNTQLSATEVPKTYTVLSNVELTKYTALHTNPANHNGTVTTKIGSLPWGRVRIKIPMNDRKGLVQRAFQYVRFGFMYFKSDATANYGKILVGCDNQDMNRLVNALQGRDTDASDGLDFTQVFPYYGTPTGPALREAYDYFAQVNKYANADNSAFVSTSTKGTLKDPYYSLDAYGVARPVPCRKSFVVLISDGEWNVGVDPVKPALEMHQAD